MITYPKVDKVSKSLYEDNDCAVKSISVALQLPYEKSRELLKARGRRNRCGTYRWMTREVVNEQGYELKECTEYFREVLGCKTLRTMNRIIDKLKGHVFLVSTRDHILAVYDGHTESWSKNSCRHIQTVYKVVKK